MFLERKGGLVDGSIINAKLIEYGKRENHNLLAFSDMVHGDDRHLTAKLQSKNWRHICVELTDSTLMNIEFSVVYLIVFVQIPLL